MHYRSQNVQIYLEHASIVVGMVTITFYKKYY